MVLIGEGGGETPAQQISYRALVITLLMILHFVLEEYNLKTGP